MAKFYYSVYSNITDDEYLDIEAKLVPIAREMSNILMPLEWQLTSSEDNEDGLVIDFTLAESDVYGNVGIIFNGQAKEKLFSFYVTKSFDVGDIRYFIRSDIFENKELEFFSKNVGLYVEDALETYGKWTKEHIKEFGESFQMPN